jgi:hypothetical protein
VRPWILDHPEVVQGFAKAFFRRLRSEIGLTCVDEGSQDRALLSFTLLAPFLQARPCDLCFPPHTSQMLASL